jgi:hypothetical protein
MGRLYRDALEMERHLGLKRWERKSQKTVWKRRGGEEEASPVDCLWKPAPAVAAEERPAYLLALYPDDFALVRYAGGSPGPDAGVYLLREGLLWGRCLPDLLTRYLRGLPVPMAFRPRRRLPSDWIEKALRWPLRLQAEWFDRLRASDLLPQLVKLDADTVAPWLRWEALRDRFLDFKHQYPIS